MNVTDLPFIEKFQIEKNFYIYDVNTNSIFKVDELIYNLIEYIENQDIDTSKIFKKYPKRKIIEAKNEINLMIEKGYFSKHRPLITYFHTLSKEDFFSHIKNTLHNRLYKVTIVIGENCNMRCKYCAYSGMYLYKRKHSHKTMTKEVLKKAVDFYFLNSRAIEEKHLSFYGGEPLFNFGLLTECVNYVKTKYNMDVHYNMTTNGTLLDNERVKFLVDNKFSLLISIDGPKDIHNQYRIFKNGKGTFDCIVRNLKKMKALYPEYYQHKVRFNVVLHPPLDFERINEFISNPEITPSSIKFSDINTHFTTFFKQFSLHQMKEFGSSKSSIRNSFYQKLINGLELNIVEKSLFRTKFYNIHRREMNKLPEKYPSNGQCIIGERTLIINTDGSLNFCSKIDDTFNLGNIFNGYDYQRIYNIYLKMDKLFSKRCFNCWAIRFCMKCIKDINKNGEVDEEVFNKYCISNKKTILNDIKNYIKIRENNYHSLDYLEEVLIS